MKPPCVGDTPRPCSLVSTAVIPVSILCPQQGQQDSSGVFFFFLLGIIFYNLIHYFKFVRLSGNGKELSDGSVKFRFHRLWH